MRFKTPLTTPRFLTMVATTAYGGFSAMAVIDSAQAAELPVPCVAGSCGSNATGFVTQGVANAVVNGNSLTVNQSTGSATLNWQSFNISSDGKVTFNQPDAASVALNRIFQADPSRILGALNSNGRVYLLNQNGIVFGAGAQVNVGGLLASSLNLSPQAVQNGIARAAVDGEPAFQPFLDSKGKPLPSGVVSVEAGAQIVSKGGQVLLFAPEVTNSGTIKTPDGQTILAAGQRVFLAVSDDPNLRGLVVEVGGGGTVTNNGVGTIAADRGNVTLAGSLVRQSGSVTATTSVRANGSIRLQARDTAGTSITGGENPRLRAERGGSLELTRGSLTAVTLDTTSDETTVDANAQPRSFVEMSGKSITIGGGATVRATAGRISALAAPGPDSQFTSQNLNSKADDSRLTIADGALLDVSGATAVLPAERNSLRVELRGSQLADSPLQRDGALRSQAVFVDVREYGTRADGTTWVGTPLADVSGDISNIRRGVQERNLNAGTVDLQSQGTVHIERGATVNVSGGQIDWQAGNVKTSHLLGENGQVYDIGNADPDLRYTGIVDMLTTTDRRWGVTRQYYVPGLGDIGHFEAARVEGRDAGSVNIVAPLFTLDGRVLGTTVSSPLQRRSPAVAFPNGTALVGSISDVLPRGATLSIGLATPVASPTPDYIAGSFELASGSSLFAPDGIRNLSIFANDSIHITGAAPLVLPAGGSLRLTAGEIRVDSTVDAPSGTISMAAKLTKKFNGVDEDTTPRLTLANGASLLARGGWVNDSLTLNPAGSTAPLYLNGGSISLSVAGGSLDLLAGSALDVSGGAQLTNAGAIVAGRAGAISLSANSSLSSDPVSLSIDATLRGFGLTNGGSLSVASNTVCISASSCAGMDDALNLRPDWFQSGGFSSISVASRLGPLTVAAGSELILRQSNLQLTGSARMAPTGTPMSSLTSVTVLPDFARKPLNLSMTAEFAGGVDFESADLSFERGASIFADALAQISFNSNSRIFLDGSVSAPGGTISALLSNSARTRSFLPDQAIWIGPGAQLSVAGTAQYQPSPLGLLTGSVYDGGSIQIQAQRGFVFTDQSSVLDVSGTAAPLDLLSGLGTYSRQQVGSDGGSIRFLAAEGMQLNGELRAAGGAVQGTAGGSLSVAIDPTQRRGVLANGYPGGDHEVLVAASSSPVVVGPGANVPAPLIGVARLPAERISEGGFDFVTLTARNLQEVDPDTAVPEIVGYGRVTFESGVALDPRARLAVDATVIGVRGDGPVSLNSSYVGLGTREFSAGKQESLAATAGTGTLDVDANFIDLIGNVSLMDMAHANLRSTGDIRARGVTTESRSDYFGRLSTAGDLDLTAQQIYPATLSNYTLETTGLTGTVTTHSVPGKAADVLSAGGTLNVNASHIVNGGVLRAPLGVLHLTAPTIDTLAGSVLSTSAQGLTIPFGQTQGGLDWVYLLGDGSLPRVYGGSGVALPAQDIVLQGGSINLAAGSTLDVSGGGDLLAYEFIKGTGGTRDVLDPAVRPNQFAVIPTLNASIAPFDPRESPGSSLQPGDQVYLSGGGGLAAGTYTLLPARYALLPGAFLVSSVGGYQDIVAGTNHSTLNGGVIVSGRRAIAGTDMLDARTSGFVVRAGSAALKDAQYSVALANAFFPARAAQSGATSQLALPRDAGAVSLIASDSFALNATLKASVASGGRGASLELSSDKLLVTENPDDGEAGYVTVSADQIDAFGAETIVLGGRRRFDSTGTVIDVGASTVKVAGDSQLSAPELILVARDLLALEAGSSVTADGSLAGTALTQIGLDSRSSLLRVSSGPQVEIKRGTSGTGTGLINFAAGSTIASPGSVAVAAGVSANTRNRFDVRGSLLLSAPQIGIGEVPDIFSGIAFDTSQAANLSELILNGRSSIDLYPGANFSGTRLTLETPAIRAVTDNVSARLTADQLTLAGTATGPAVPSSCTVGCELQLTARRLDAKGSMSLVGFQDSSLTGNEWLGATGSGSLTTAGDLTLAAGWLTGLAGVDYSFTGGAVTLQTRDIANVVQPSGDLGARLSIKGDSIAGDARVSLPAGQLDLIATGLNGLTLGAGTIFDVAGRSRVFDDKTIGVGGGAINLAALGGNIAVASNARLNVSGSGAGAAGGAVALTAPQGAVDFAGQVSGTAQGARGGSLAVDARVFDFTNLLDTFDAGGFTGDWNLRLEGPGDLRLLGGETLRASSLLLTADAGSIEIAGNVNAAAPRGGYVGLNASGPIQVSGSIDARATDAGVAGGRVELFSGSGVFLNAQSSINVSGSPTADPELPTGGRVYVRLPRTAFGNLQLAGNIVGARQVSLEGYQSYQVGSGEITFTDVSADFANPWYADAAAFMADAPQRLAALGHANDPTYQIVPGLELTSPGDLRLSADWNLHDWRFGDSPGTLTLRAGGDLFIDRSLSDGFASINQDASSFLLTDLNAQSWSYRLIAGAAFASANPLAVQPAALAQDAAQNSGSLMLAPGFSSSIFSIGSPVMVRTGTGRIDIATANDVVFGNQASVIYTAGNAGPGIRVDAPHDFGGLSNLAYPFDGGDIRIAAGRDLIGPHSPQFFTEWMWRSGSSSELAPAATAWTVAFDLFEQGVATLGGGRLSLLAGRDITDMSAATPSIGRQIGSTDPAGSVVQTVGGGDLEVRAGRDVLGGAYYSDGGVSSIVAGNRIGGLANLSGSPLLAPVLALGSGTLRAEAVRDLSIAAILNPTLIGVSQAVSAGFDSYLGTYTDTSAVALTSLAGALDLMTDRTTLVGFQGRFPSYPTSNITALTPLSIAPPNVRATAMSDSLRIGGSMALWPAPHGNLELFAHKNVAFESVNSSEPFNLLVSDASIDSLPTPAHPGEGIGSLDDLTLFLSAATARDPRFNALEPVHNSAANGLDDSPLHIVAATGDITMQVSRAGRYGLLYSPKPIRVAAGRDIVNFAAQVQNLTANDVSSLFAGRDFTYLIARDADTGSVLAAQGGISVDGPGRLEVTAGRNVDLQASSGLVTQGNVRNTALAPTGADVSVLAGVGNKQPDYEGFIDRYLGGMATYDKDLQAFVARELGVDSIGKAEALGAFRAFGRIRQRALLENIMIAELRAGGRSAAQAGVDNADFTRAFTALQTLFPGANPDTKKGETNPFAGDIRLFFSRVYTLDGGDINLFAPGGEINVGLATPPVAFGLQKKPSDLGLVAQASGSLSAVSYRDFQVNESRAFAADGGNILVWSTGGDIDAGRGAKTAISAPPPVITIDSQGRVIVQFPPALSGSGIQTLATTPGRKPGDVDLFAPRGVVNAGDAGIVAGNLTIAATAVLGANNIQVSGTSVGVPVDTGGLGASLAGASSTAAAASNAGQQSLEGGATKKSAPLAETALGWLDVFIEGFGDEVCKPSDEECLKRNRKM